MVTIHSLNRTVHCTMHIKTWQAFCVDGCVMHFFFFCICIRMIFQTGPFRIWEFRWPLYNPNIVLKASAFDMIEQRQLNVCSTEVLYIFHSVNLISISTKIRTNQDSSWTNQLPFGNYMNMNMEAMWTVNAQHSNKQPNVQSIDHVRCMLSYRTIFIHF